MLSKSIAAILPIAFAHFMSLCHILIILAISNFFIVGIFVMGSVIHDLWRDYCKKIRTCPKRLNDEVESVEDMSVQLEARLLTRSVTWTSFLLPVQRMIPISYDS